MICFERIPENCLVGISSLGDKVLRNFDGNNFPIRSEGEPETPDFTHHYFIKTLNKAYMIDFDTHTFD